MMYNKINSNADDNTNNIWLQRKLLRIILKYFAFILLIVGTIFILNDIIAPQLITALMLIILFIVLKFIFKLLWIIFTAIIKFMIIVIIILTLFLYLC